MDRETAQKLITMMLDCSKKLDETITLVSDSCNADEAKKFRSAAGKIMGHIFVDLLDPVYRMYPEFEPDELKSKR